jgi:hypothetical protein
MRTLLRSAFLLGLFLAPAAYAWSPLGHELVGELAQRQLSPEAQRAVAQLLQGEPDPTLRGVAYWADALRGSDPERFQATSRWHYLKTPAGQCVYEAARDCPDGACVVGAIEQQLRVLGDAARPVAERRDALKFVVHLVGDAHQPFHASHHEDRGANQVALVLHTRIEPEAYARANYRDGVMQTNLHSLWDYYVLASRGLPVLAYADRLQLGDAPAAGAPTRPAAWTFESCSLIDARRLYPAGPVLQEGDLAAFRPLAEQRMRQAGFRLAQQLNTLFSPP